MLGLVAIAALLFHVYFLYYVWVNIGILWALAAIFIPFFVFYVAYAYWHDVKVPFIGELVCSVILFASI